MAAMQPGPKAKTASRNSTTAVVPFESPPNDRPLGNLIKRKMSSMGLFKLTMYVVPEIMALICFAWTIWLGLLTVKPNDTVNWVMKTENFDNGSFWLLVDLQL
ncbi:hypothetical protein PHYSODRAFT_295564 [Phytophthora sojae]|uniref:Uncharacterized protein n=1 Tax=Phytophthora sojae (strain P6497) TaxID=1094619 RepID=G4YSG4_PHYSP|nr:hypothetical protein PHYSODRAFT_295564 [Phytophthora sojae]EGZ22980.1 hypothetical protein PHYSODRAFT_295564 [Phytophthora sojae]|eukprot:XP_009518268.1 hypothetical protein PHYSODRAFT_295564 [Phytophthora sojae]